MPVRPPTQGSVPGALPGATWAPGLSLPYRYLQQLRNSTLVPSELPDQVVSGAQASVLQTGHAERWRPRPQG